MRQRDETERASVLELCANDRTDYIGGRINGKPFVFLVGPWRPNRFGLRDGTSVVVYRPSWRERLARRLICLFGPIA